MPDFLNWLPSDKRNALRQCTTLEVRVLVLPENVDDAAASLEHVAREYGVFLVSNQALLPSNDDVQEALDNWSEVSQTVESLLDDEQTSRFWIDVNPTVTPFKETYAVVDEKEGGVVAYFCTREKAEAYIDDQVKD